jgi:hypothetical protein
VNDLQHANISDTTVDSTYSVVYAVSTSTMRFFSSASKLSSSYHHHCHKYIIILPQLPPQTISIILAATARMKYLLPNKIQAAVPYHHLPHEI